MSDESAFLDVLKACPADDTTRLVYADWLDERDESAKANYLRAVVELTQLPGGTPEYLAAGERLCVAAVQIDALWRDAAGARFDLFLTGCDLMQKIAVIKTIREIAGLGLAEAKAITESVPTAVWSWRPFDRLVYALASFDRVRSGVTADIRPTPWPAGPNPGAVFDVMLSEHEFGPDLEGNGAGYAVEGLARLLGTTKSVIRDKLRRLPFIVGSGLQPAAVSDFVRRVKLVCNVHRALPPGAIRVVPRVPTA